MIESVHDFAFEEDGHRYVENGVAHISCTGMLQQYKLIDLSMVKAELLEQKRVIGSQVHAFTAEYDRTGSEDLLRVCEEAEGYCQGWMRFKRENSAFQVVEIEQPMMGSIYGVKVGCTPDRVMRYKRTRDLLPDLKTSACKMPWWKLQTATYEMVKTKVPHLGNMQRLSVQLFPDGRYHCDWQDDISDADAVLAIFSLHAWKKNHKLK